MAFNPNAVFISPSSIADLDKCPQLYYYRTIFKSPRGLKIQVTSPALTLGTAVHDAIDQFMKLEVSDRKDEELFRLYEFVWEGMSGEKGGFISADTESENKNRGILMLQKFLANTDFRTKKAAEFPVFPKVEIGPDLILTGKLDWIQKEKDGSYTIIDFKTGKNKEKEDSFQLPVYTILVKKLLKTDDVQAKYWYLEESAEMEDKQLPDLDEAIVKIRQKGEIMQMVRQTNSFKCQSGGESCWACRDMKAAAEGKAKLVRMDPSHKQEIYILPKEVKNETEVNDLPF